MIGVDIVYLIRFKSIIESKNGEKLIRRIYTDDELIQCQNKCKEERIQSLAGRFAIKEAVIKASKGELTMSDLHNIEIRQDSKGFFDVLIMKDSISCRQYKASISHDGEYVLAVSSVANC